VALANLGQRQALAPLVLALRDPESGVRRLAIASLSRIDSHWTAAPEVRDAADQLKSVLKDMPQDVRYFVIQFLVGLGKMEPEAAEKLVENEPSQANRRKLAVNLFERILADADRDLRQAAAEALGRLGGDRAAAALKRAQPDLDADVRQAVEEALSALSG